MPEDAMVITLPLVGVDPVELVGSFPITEAAYNHMLVMLEAMKPGLVVTQDDDS